MSDEVTEQLATYWHPIARSEAVGDVPVRSRLLGQDLVAFRSQGRLAVFHDVCIHRGTALSLGWVEGGVLTCPYHGWQYDGTGACVRIPSLPPDHAIPAKARARTYAASDAYGLVWVALAPSPSPLPPPEGFGWDEEGFRSFVIGPYEWDASAGRVAENVLDFSHFPWVHENLLAVRERAVVAPHSVQATSDGLEYRYEQTRPGSPHNDFRDEVVTNDYRVVLPFVVHDRKTVMVTGHETVLTFVASPESPRRAKVFVVISRNYDLDGDDAPYSSFTETILGQDQAIVESQRPELLPVDLRDELHVKLPDTASIAYRKALAAIVGEESEYVLC